MPLYEYYCGACKFKFEEISSSNDPIHGQCPKCGKTETEKLISAFKVGGRGDLRESTLHGCHDAHVPHSADSDDHSGHDHD